MICLHQRLTNWLLLAAYLCASTVGGLLHSHEHGVASHDLPKPACSEHSHSHHEHHHAGHSHSKHAHAAHRHADHKLADHKLADHKLAGHVACSSGAEDSARTSHPPEHRHHHDHDDCTACRFLGQVSLPVQVVPADMPLGPSIEPPAEFITAPSYGVARATLHLRAGPTAV